MKTFKKIVLSITLVLFFALAVNAQTFNFPIKNAKRLVIENLLGEISIVGYNGSEIVVECTNYEAPPKRADGLKPIFGGAEDNTGIGLYMNIVENIIEINGASRQSSDANYVFKVPNSLALKVDYSSPFAEGNLISFADFSNEVEVSTLDADLEFMNVTGAITTKVIDGDIKAIFNTVNQNNPINLYTVDGEIDVTLPATVNANIFLSTIDGEVYSDMEIEFSSDSKSKNLAFIGGGMRTSGKLNKGGVEINLKTIDGIIYLRKK